MRIPEHIAVIPDGNRRWAVAHGKRRRIPLRTAAGAFAFAPRKGTWDPGDHILRVYR